MSDQGRDRRPGEPPGGEPLRARIRRHGPERPCSPSSGSETSPAEAASDRSLSWRRAGPEDAASVRTLTRAAYARWVPLIGREPLPMTADYQVAVRDHRIDLLMADGVLVGLVETIDEGDVLLVENVAVAPGRQGEGLGRRLMARAEAVARELGCERLRLYTNQRFETNVALYLRLGYQIDGETPVAGVGVRVDMSKRLGAD